MEMAFEASIGLQAVNIVLLLALISVYVMSLRKLKSSFTIGLLIFASFLLIQNVVGICLEFFYMHSMTENFENYAFAVNMAQTVALASLFWMSWK